MKEIKNKSITKIQTNNIRIEENAKYRSNDIIELTNTLGSHMPYEPDYIQPAVNVQSDYLISL